MEDVRIGLILKSLTGSESYLPGVNAGTLTSVNDYMCGSDDLDLADGISLRTCFWLEDRDSEEHL